MIRLLQEEEEYVDWEDRMYNDYMDSLSDAEREVERFWNIFASNFGDYDFTYGYDYYQVTEACSAAKGIIFSILGKLKEGYKVLPVKVDSATTEKEDTKTDLYLEVDMSVYFDNNDVINSRLLDKIAQIVKSRYARIAKIKKKGSAEIIVDLGTYGDFECEFYVVIRSSKQIEFLYSAHIDKTKYTSKEDNDEYADEYDI